MADGTDYIVDARGNLQRAAVNLVIDAINNAFSGGTKGLTGKQRAEFVARGGEIRNPRTRVETFLIDGVPVTRRAARIFSRGPLNTAAPLPAPSVPGQTGSVLDDLLKQPGKIGSRDPNIFDELLRRPSTAGQGDINRGPVVRAAGGSLAAILARGAGLLGGLLYVEPNPGGVKSDRRDEFPDPKKGPIQPPPNQPPKGPRTRPVISRPVIAPRPVLRSPASPRIPRPTLPTYEPRSIPSARPREIPSGPISPTPNPVTDQRPSTVPGPTAAPATAPTSIPLALGLPLLAPLVLGSPSSSLRPGRARAIDAPYRFADPIGLTQFQPGALSSPLTRSAPSSSSDNCRCTKPTRNRKPRKPRDTCYKGEYIEKANGITKFRKRKIPCR